MGDGGERTGLYVLETLSDISLVALPDVMPAHAAGVLDSQSASAAQMAAVVHCELLGDCVAILDAPRGTSAQQIYEWRQTRDLDTACAALYRPWVLVETPGARILAPPSGHIAGVLARLDLQVGPHPSSLQELVRGAVDVEVHGSSSERDQLNPAGINVLDRGPTKPVAVGGARTLTDSRPEFRMLHDRRLLNFIADNVVERTEWALPARADEREVWRQLAHDVASFLELLWCGGALAGATAAEA
jgi:phage tail sheath protein FI